MESKMQDFNTAFVTGATGLLGNNLVRQLLKQGVRVKALARSEAKAKAQFKGLDVEIVVGDMTDINSFAKHLQGSDVLFHTAAFFRDNYKGGKHWDELFKINVEGTRKLLEAAYQSGVRRVVHTSSIAVLDGPSGSPIDESMSRKEENADDYYRSKILSENTVRDFLKTHPDMRISFVLPGWMFGPGDLGPTSSGQFVQDFLGNKLPGIPPGTFSVVDARDVAGALIQVAKLGRSGERYLAAGRNMDMKQLMQILESVSGVRGPTKQIPFRVLYVMALFSEIYARLSGRPVLLGLGSVKLLGKEAGKSTFDHSKSQSELSLQFRPVEETLKDVLHDMSGRQ
jgi:nucleoside-diphosphate-sugar epimerase